MNKLLKFSFLALLLFVAFRQSLAADHKEWVMLTNCQYVAGKSNDGDSFRVRCDTNEFIARLYFVDAPETNLKYPEQVREQSEHFGVTLDQTMKAGTMARDMVREFLREPFIVWTRWTTAGGRSKELRYYVLVEAGGKSLAEALVSQGLARTKGAIASLPTGEKSKSYVARLEVLERDAQQKRLGVWANSIPSEIKTDAK